ncbi:MAG TPA: lipid-binding SYLF domain-containing protein [Micropepsaceae bacterium]|nr:lipid-binding SYLF domain-containing protein [Micropepsaceae bacterium]
MRKLSMLGAALAFTALFLFGNSASFAAPTSEQNDLLARAATTAQHMQKDPAFDRARAMLHNAKGVLIVPSLVKGGFIFGAEGGNGVLMQRNGNGWSAPAFYTLASASFGFQAGLEQAEVVMLVMSDRALDAIKRSEFKVGAGAGITVVTLSAGAEAATAPNLSGDIIVWSSATGVYGGLTLNGSVIKARDEWNTAFYGRPSSVSDILADRVGNPQADRLRQQLAAL